MESHPDLMNTHKWYDYSREEMWINGMKKTRKAYELDKEKWFHQAECFKVWWGHAHQGVNCGNLNYSMFLMSLQNMCNEEQAKKWVPLCRQMRISGCYAQTELGHGSDVSALETTATFDHATDEFVIHTPTIGATKFWPGDIGCFSTHAIVFAKLIIGKNTYGVIPFIV